MNTINKVSESFADKVFDNIRLTSRNPDIDSLINKTVLNGGKRVRPKLIMLIGKMLGLEPKLLQPVAEAIELVHAATLAHDDVIDNASIRRSLPSINALTSNKKAVLAGDYLLAEVLVDIAGLENPLLLKEIARVISELTEGEWLQLDSIKSENVSRQYVDNIAIRKTGSVMGWCCVAPAIIARLPDYQVSKLRTIGHNIGLLFQWVDDLSDFKQSDESGKEINIDAVNDVMNSVFIRLIEIVPEIDASSSSKNSGILSDLVIHPRLPEAVEVLRKDVLELSSKINSQIDDLYFSLDPALRSKGDMLVLKGVVQSMKKRSI